LEAPERNVKWILGVSLIILGVSAYYGYFYFLSYPSGTITHDVWYYLTIAVHLFSTLAVASSALYIANFAKKWTYDAAVFLFIVLMALVFLTGLRPLFY
jgi:hypothetical protein